MKKQLFISLAVLLVIAATTLFFTVNNIFPFKAAGKPFAEGNVDNPNARRDFEFKKIRDINTNRIPENIFNLEQDFASKLPKVEDKR